MNFKKTEYRQLKTKWNETEKGQIAWIIAPFMLLFLGTLLCGQMQLEVFRMSSVYLEDALAASNLASAVIDVEEYGISHKLVISDLDEAYDKYCVALKGNLGLNEAWECENKHLIDGTVRVEKYIVYNVTDEEIVIHGRDAEGNLWESQYATGQVYAPNGEEIVTTSVYSEISYPTKGMWNVEIQAHKGKLVDIVLEE